MLAAERLLKVDEVLEILWKHSEELQCELGMFWEDSYVNGYYFEMSAGVYFLSWDTMYQRFLVFLGNYKNGRGGMSIDAFKNIVAFTSAEETANHLISSIRGF